MEKPPNTAVIVLAAGKGTRMRSDLPKVLHKVAGAPMLMHALGAAEAVDPDEVVVVTSAEAEKLRAEVKAEFKGVHFAVQPEQRGTGDAVRYGLEAMEPDWDGIVLVAYGDMPLLTGETLTRAVQAVSGEVALCVIGMRVTARNAYGRLILSAPDRLERIVEYKDATEEERAVVWCNSGILAVRADLLRRMLPKLTPANKQGELYLTDVVGLARAEGAICAMVEGDATELTGVNGKAELAQAEADFQARLRRKFLEAAVTLIAPDTVHFAHDTEIGRDVVIHPFVVFGPGAKVLDGAEIKSFSHIEGAEIGEGAKVGPYARLRPGSVLEKGAHVGNFVELKNTRLEMGAKANHLSYLGDATIGANANIGAGTITCNYDGYSKHQTKIGKQAFIGSNSALVAPVTIGDGAIIAAGSVITDDVETDALAVARAPQKMKPGWAKSFRQARNN